MASELVSSELGEDSQPLDQVKKPTHKGWDFLMGIYDGDS